MVEILKTMTGAYHPGDGMKHGEMLVQTQVSLRMGAGALGLCVDEQRHLRQGRVMF